MILPAALIAAGLVIIYLTYRHAVHRRVIEMLAEKAATAEKSAKEERARADELNLAAIKRKFIELDRAAVPPPAPRAVPSGRATVLDADKFTRIWRATHADTELFQAVQQLLALETVAAIDDATNPTLADRPGSLAAAQAQVNALLSFAATLDAARLTPEKWAPKSRP